MLTKWLENVVRKYFHWKNLNTHFKDCDHLWPVVCSFSFWNIVMKTLKNALAIWAISLPWESMILVLSIYFFFHSTYLWVSNMSLLCQVLGVLASKPSIVPLLWEHMWLYDYRGSGDHCIALHLMIDRWTGAVL